MTSTVVSLEEVRRQLAAKTNGDNDLLRMGAVAETTLFSRAAIMAALALLDLAGITEMGTDDEGQGAVLRLRPPYVGMDVDEVGEAALSGLLDVMRQAGMLAVPVAPPTAKRRGPPEAHPWRTMPVHGTFRIPPGPTQGSFPSLRATCSSKGKKLGKVFKCHRYPDGTYEVWRQS